MFTINLNLKLVLFFYAEKKLDNFWMALLCLNCKIFKTCIF